MAINGCGCGGQKIEISGTGSDVPLPDISTMPRAAQARTTSNPTMRAGATPNGRVKRGTRGPCTYIATTWAPIPGAC